MFGYSALMRLQSCHAGAVLFQCNLISCKMSCVHGWLLHSAASHSRRRFTDFSLFFPHVTTMMAFHTSTRHATASRQIMTAKWDSSTNYTHVKCHDSKANCCNVPNWDNVSLWSYSMLKKKKRFRGGSHWASLKHWGVCNFNVTISLSCQH